METISVHCIKLLFKFATNYSYMCMHKSACSDFFKTKTGCLKKLLINNLHDFVVNLHDDVQRTTYEIMCATVIANFMRSTYFKCVYVKSESIIAYVQCDLEFLNHTNSNYQLISNKGSLLRHPAQ